MKTDWKWIIIACILAVVGGFFWGRSTLRTETVKVPLSIEYKIPSVEGGFEVATGLIPVKETEYRYIPSTGREDLVAKYDSLQNEIDKRDLYLETIKQRSYSETFEDDILAITANATVTGYLDSLDVRYKTKPQQIKIDTVIPVEVKSPLSLTPYFMGSLNTDRPDIILGADLTFPNNLSVGVAKSFEQGRWYGKVGYRIKF